MPRRAFRPPARCQRRRKHETCTNCVHNRQTLRCASHKRERPITSRRASCHRRTKPPTTTTTKSPTHHPPTCTPSKSRTLVCGPPRWALHQHQLLGSHSQGVVARLGDLPKLRNELLETTQLHVVRHVVFVPTPPISVAIRRHFVPSSSCPPDALPCTATCCRVRECEQYA